MTSSLSNILNEMVSKLVNEGVAMFVQIDSNVEDQLEILKEWAASSLDYSEDQCYSMAGYSLRLWDETLICDCKPRFILKIQELVFDLIRSLRQPQFQSAEWLQIKSEIALTLGKKYAQLNKANDTFMAKAVTCFEYVENHEEIDQIVEYKIRSMLAHIETIYDSQFENASNINDRLQLLLKTQNRNSVLTAVTFYNVGLNLVRQRQHKQAVYWLNYSFEHGVNSEHVDDICRLLADAYLGLDGVKYWEKAQEVLRNVENGLKNHNKTVAVEKSDQFWF